MWELEAGSPVQGSETTIHFQEGPIGFSGDESVPAASAQSSTANLQAPLLNSDRMIGGRDPDGFRFPGTTSLV